MGLTGLTKDEMVSRLREYFLKRNDVEMAFLFGSWSRDRACEESDVDVAVYMASPANGLWTEYDKEFSTESEVWNDIEKILGKESDVVVLNRAFPSVACNALNGIPIVIKNRNVFVNLILRISSEAIDLREWVMSFWKMKQRRKYGNAV